MKKQSMRLSQIAVIGVLLAACGAPSSAPAISSGRITQPPPPPIGKVTRTPTPTTAPIKIIITDTPTPMPPLISPHPGCVNIMQPDLFKMYQANRNAKNPRDTYWMFSVNFKEFAPGSNQTRPLACLKVYARGNNTFVDATGSDGILLDVCRVVGAVKFSSANLPPKMTKGTQGMRAEFAPGSYIACDLSGVNTIKSASAPYKQVLADVETYDEGFAIGAAGILAESANGNVNTPLIYEPDKQACTEQQASCEPTALLMPEDAKHVVTFNAYINTPITPKAALLTSHAYTNTLPNRLGNSACEFDAIAQPQGKQEEQSVWWMNLGQDQPPGSTGQTGLFHYTYDIENWNKWLGCDRVLDSGVPPTPKGVQFWTGAAKVYIGGSPNSQESWQGELYEVIIDPSGSGPNSDG